MRPITITRQLAAAAVGAICAAQTTAGAGNLLINGTLASGGVATMTAQQIVGISSTGNLTGVNFTLAGTDDQGRVIGETLAGPNNGTVQTVLNYRTVTAIAVNGAVGTNVTVDTVQIGASQEIPIDIYIKPPTTISLAVEVTGSVNYTVQYTFDDVYGGAPGPFNWLNFTTLTGLTANANGTLIAPVRAVRLSQNSTGVAKLLVIQQGLT